MKGKYYFFSIFTVILCFLNIAGCGCIQQENRKIIPIREQKKSQPYFRDTNVEIYRQTSVIKIINRGTGDVIFTSRYNSVSRISGKPADNSPLVGVPIASGITLMDDREQINIIQTEPDFKILVSYPNPRTEGDKILVDKGSNILYLFKGGELYGTYPVATGKEPEYTPEGNFKIVNKIENSSNNTLKPQLGQRWMGLGIPYEKDRRAQNDIRAPKGCKYGIHGTNEPESIGRHVSGGCIRLDNEQIAELFELVEVGTPVEIKKWDMK